MLYIILIIAAILLIRWLCGLYGKRTAEKWLAREAERKANEPPKTYKPLPLNDDCRQMIYCFFDVIRELYEKVSYLRDNPAHFSMYGGGDCDMHLHIEFDTGVSGIRDTVDSYLNYNLPVTQPENGGWYANDHFICFDSNNLTGGAEWVCNSLNSEAALSGDIERIIKAYFPSMNFRIFKVSLLMNYISFNVLSE